MKRILLLGLLAPLLASCAVVGNVVRTPTFEMKEAGFERFDPPGLDGPAKAVIRLTVEGRNPNPAGGRIEDLGFDLLLEGAKVVNATAPSFELAANNTPKLIPIDIEVPVTPATLVSLLKIAKGDPVTYRLEGAFRVDLGVLGKPRFGPYTMAQGTYRAPTVVAAPPSFAWRSDLTRLTLGIGGAVLDLGFEVTNPSPIGYRLVAPLSLTAGGQIVAKAEAGGTVRGKDKGVIYSRFQIDPLAAARVIVSGRFDFGVSGAPSLEVPGLQSYAFPLSVLFSGTATGR